MSKKVGIAIAAIVVAAAVFVLVRRQRAPRRPVVHIAAVAFSSGGKTGFAGVTSIVQQEGWLARTLADKGWDVQFIPIPPASVGAQINEGIANGSIDFASYGDLPSIILNAGGVRTRLVVPTGRGTDTFLLVPTASTASSIRDLKGKKIALHRGRPWELSFSRLLDANGLAYADFEIVNLNPEAGAAALAGKQVDALFAMSDAAQLTDKGIAKSIWSTASAPADWKVRAELWAAQTFLDAHADIAQVVATAFVKAAHYASLEEHQDEFIKLSSRNGVPESLTRNLYVTSGVAWKDNFSPLFDGSVVEHYRYATHYAFGKQLVRVELAHEDLLDRRFVARALDELNIRDWWQPCVLDDAGKVACASGAHP